MCRLFTYGDAKRAGAAGALSGASPAASAFLLPWCLDKWRKFVKERKVMRYWLKWAERRCNRPSASVKIAFDTWASEVAGRQRKAWATPYHHLKD